MVVELIIDNREHDLIKLFQEKSLDVKIEQLDIGDILYRDSDSQELVLVIERKTVSDLKASICDGRAREQKARLLGSGLDSCRIMYLIEGSMDYFLNEKCSGLPVSTLLGSIINTQLRDNIKVYKTASLKETVEYLTKLLEKIDVDGEKYFLQQQSITPGEYAGTLKKQKKANMTPEVWMIAQLSLIPQVTEKIATEIVKKYSTIAELVLEYIRTPDHIRDKLLVDIEYSIKDGKKRKIGNKVSSRIHKFIILGE